MQVKWGSAALTAGVVVLAAVLAAAASLGGVAMVLAIGVAGFLLVALVFGLHRTGVAVMVAAFGTAPMYRGIEGLSGGIATPTDLLLFLGLGLLLPSLLYRKLSVPLPFALGLMIVASCGLVVTAVSPDPVPNLFSLVQWLFFLGGLPIMIAWWRPTTPTVVTMLWAYVAGHMVSTAVALAEGPLENDRYDGLTHHSNAFGLAGMASIAILCFLFHHHTDLRVRALLLGFGAVSALSLTLSGSRAATLVSVALVLMVPIVERSALSGFVLASVGALVVFSLPLLVDVSGEGSALSRLAGDATAEIADQKRTAALDAGVDRFLSSPLLGTGLVDVETIHNVFLEVAAAVGILGLAGYVLVVFVTARPLFFNHPLRRLGYLTWAFVGVAPAIPGIWDRTIWVPMSLAILPALARREDDAVPEVVARREPAAPAR